MSAPAPELKEWEGLKVFDGEVTPCIDVKLWKDGMSCHIQHEGAIMLDLDRRYLPFHQLRAMVNEAESVGRHYWGDDWGRGK